MEPAQRAVRIEATKAIVRTAVFVRGGGRWELELRIEEAESLRGGSSGGEGRAIVLRGALERGVGRRRSTRGVSRVVVC